MHAIFCLWFLLLVTAVGASPRAIFSISPFSGSSPKVINILNFDEDPFSRTSTVGAYLKDCQAENRSAFLSSNDLSTEPVRDIGQIKDILEGFDVTVVVLYRELLSLIVSQFSVLNRLEDKAIFSFEPFAVYVTKNLDRLNTILSPMTILQEYIAVFGRENIAIIDMLGCQAEARDINHVLMCEVAGMQCDQAGQLIEKYEVPSSDYSQVSVELFFVFSEYVERQLGGACRLCEAPQDAFRTFEATLSSAPTAPLIHTNLGMLRPYAEQMDAALREQYGDRILYGNRTANLEEMRNRVRVESVDVEAVLTGAEWSSWMSQAFSTALAQGQICGCDGLW